MSPRKFSNLLFPIAAGLLFAMFMNESRAGPSMKVLTIGDSITASSCWRAKLWVMVKGTAGRQLDFIGTRAGADCGVAGFDDDHEGHNCYITADLLNAPGTGTKNGCDDGDTYRGDLSDLVKWVSKTHMPEPPEVILIHLGTNDVIRKVNPERTMSALTLILGMLRERNPASKFLVAKIIPMAPGIGDVGPMNEALTKWVKFHHREASPVQLVDMNTGFRLEWTRDGLHPNDNVGSEFMAKRWFQALQPLR